LNLGGRSHGKAGQGHRSKLFVIERLDAVEEIDAARIARAIEYTRFPYVDALKGEVDDLNEEEGLLLRAADLIGQLGDPNYMRKSNALFHEFEEIGLNKKLGCATPADSADPACDPLSQCHLQRPAMDRQPSQQCFSS
jgi:hypothetical protein